MKQKKIAINYQDVSEYLKYTQKHDKIEDSKPLSLSDWHKQTYNQLFGSPQRRIEFLKWSGKNIPSSRRYSLTLDAQVNLWKKSTEEASEGFEIINPGDSFDECEVVFSGSHATANKTLFVSKDINDISNGHRSGNKSSKFNWGNITFSGKFLRNMDFSESHFEALHLENIELDNVTFARATIDCLVTSGQNTKSSCKFKNVDFREATIKNAFFSNINADGLNLSRANIKNSQFSSLNLVKLRAVGTSWHSTTIHGSSIAEANFDSSIFLRSKLSSNQLFNTGFDKNFKLLESQIDQCSFSYCHLASGVIDKTIFNENHFLGSDLSNTQLLESPITDITFMQCSLSDFSCRKSNLSHAIFCFTKGEISLNDLSLRSMSFNYNQGLNFTLKDVTLYQAGSESENSTTFKEAVQLSTNQMKEAIKNSRQGSRIEEPIDADFVHIAASKSDQQLVPNYS